MAPSKVGINQLVDRGDGGMAEADAGPCGHRPGPLLGMAGVGEAVVPHSPSPCDQGISSSVRSSVIEIEHFLLTTLDYELQDERSESGLN